MLGIVHTYFFFAQGKYRQAMPSLSDLPDIVPTIKYYLFLEDDKPDYAKYNPIQKLSYAALFVISAGQAMLGFALYAPKYFEGIVYGMGGLMVLRSWHLVITWAFISFTLAHLYLVFSEDIRLFFALLNGYYYRKVPKKE